MAEIQVPERLLRGMQLGRALASSNGVSCYELTHAATGQRFVLKHMSIPASEEKLEALILSGAYADREEAGRYYQHVAEDLVREIRCNRSLSDCPNILRFLSYQLVPRESGVGFDLYTITSRLQSLREFRSRSAMSHLDALNLGIDLCAALEAIHEAGFVFQDLCPGNVFMTENGRFLLGDFGLASMQDMQFSSLPEQFMSEYSAPELGDVLTGLNKTIDIYSLGMLLYRIYNGYHAPFEDETTGASAAEERRRSGEALPAPLYADYELAGILSKACAFLPEERYQTPTEFRQALMDYMRRNEVSDELIVPPLVNSEDPIDEDLTEDMPEPVRFANVEELDETFKTHFAPDTGSLNAVISAVRKEEARQTKRGSAPEKDGTVFVSENPAGQTPEPPASEPSAAPAQKPAAEPAARTRKTAKQRKAEKAAAKKAERKKKKRHVGGWIVLGVLGLLVAAVLLYCFTGLGHDLYEFDIVVDRLSITETTNNSLTVEIVSNAEPGLLTASCQDAYGNAVSKSVESGTLVFEDLTPGTQYTVNLSLEGFHRLSGVTSATAVTGSMTEVLTFSAAAAPEEGAVTLTLVVKDESVEPDEWELSIEAAGEPARTQKFAGHSTQVTGLTVGTEYTFRLLESEGCSLLGQTETSFTPALVIRTEALTLDALLDGVATLQWRCLSELPEQWNVTVEGPSGTRELTVPESAREPGEDGSYLCRAELEGIEPGQTYVFRVSAEGMFQSELFTLDESVPYVSDFTAAVEDDSITLSWQSDYQPEAGWTLTVSPDGSEEMLLGRVVVTENSYRLEFGADDEQIPLLPDTDYSFELSAGNDVKLLGHTKAAVRSASVPVFKRLGIDIMTTHTGLYKTPQSEDWDYETLLKYDPQTQFSVSDSIEIMLRNRHKVDASDFTASILLIVRDSEGKLVSFHSFTQNWNDMWGTRHWVIHLPQTPQTPGTYTVEVYVGNERMQTSEPLRFTVS